MSGTRLTPSVSAEPLLADLHQLAAIGKQPDAGITRLAYTPEEQKARAWMVERSEKLGLMVSVDAIGNVEARSKRSKRAPTDDVLSGSHLDTVSNGGPYDGALGVVCSVHAVRALQELNSGSNAGIVGFAAEESTRFGAGCIGSRGLVGELKAEDLDRLIDTEGVSLRQALEESGLDPHGIEATKRQPNRWARAFLELHIDQATDLLEAGCPIGVVTSIAAPLRLRAKVEGVASHSGATRMRNRKDALAAAAGLIVAVEDIARRLEPKGAWATVGSVKVYPGTFNTVPGAATLDVEIRACERKIMEFALRSIEKEFQRTHKERGTLVTWETISRSEPAAVPAWLTKLIEQVCKDLKIPYVRIESRAAHDSMYVSRLAPAGMILVRNRSGISHSPLEEIHPDDIVLGANVLANCIHRLANAIVDTYVGKSSRTRPA